MALKYDQQFANLDEVQQKFEQLITVVKIHIEFIPSSTFLQQHHHWSSTERSPLVARRRIVVKRWISPVEAILTSSPPPEATPASAVVPPTPTVAATTPAKTTTTTTASVATPLAGTTEPSRSVPAISFPVFKQFRKLSGFFQAVKFSVLPAIVDNWILVAGKVKRTALVGRRYCNYHSIAYIYHSMQSIYRMHIFLLSTCPPAEANGVRKLDTDFEDKFESYLIKERINITVLHSKHAI